MAQDSIMFLLTLYLMFIAIVNSITITFMTMRVTSVRHACISGLKYYYK